MTTPLLAVSRNIMKGMVSFIPLQANLGCMNPADPDEGQCWVILAV